MDRVIVPKYSTSSLNFSALHARAGVQCQTTSTQSRIGKLLSRY